ncbi:MAG: DUF3048 domain-containing protein [Acidimicrobiia bacterium]|nr:DUF3048 domain-containing protein [Acidimicrobiia bacterium]
MRFIRRASLFVVFALIAAACSGDSSETTTTVAITTLPPVTTSSTTTSTTTTSTTTTTTSSTTTTTLGPQNPSPLNGADVADPTALDRRAIAVKIDNHPSARPQSGIQEADMVYELLVEGGLTRFIAVFHDGDSEYVGPVRSLRPTDSTLVVYLDAPLQISGGQDWIQSLSRSRGLDMISDDRISTYRIGSRSSPHNLYATTLKMRETADRRGWSDEAPEPIFTFGAATPALTPATEVTMDWSDRPEVVWRFDEELGAYLRFNRDTPHDWLARNGDREQISAETLLVLTARKYTASPGSGKGTPVPALDTLGTGSALLFYDGGLLEGTWERDSYDDSFSLKLITGAEMVLPAGTLWISVFPTSGSLDWE